MSLFNELKRRNVFRVGIAYMVVAWLILQVVDVLQDILTLPGWVGRLILLLLLIGLPLALLFAWAFELTPDGIKREHEVDRSASIRPRTGRKLDFIIIGVLVIVVGLLLADRFFSDDDSNGPELTEPAISSAQDDGRTSLAVIPFVNMSDDQQNEYFSDGISEELLNVLVGIEGLRVPSRTSSFTFKNSNLKVGEIGRELGVEHVLEGSVRKAGQRIRVTAQLIDVRTDTHLWSETYTRELDDIFAVQDEIAQAIVSALKLTLSGADQEKLELHTTDNVEAYNKYLIALHLWNQRTKKSLKKSIEYLLEAVSIDPNFSRAWSTLGQTYVVMPEYLAGSIEEYIPLAREATQKALEINPYSVRALTTSGYYKAYYDFDWVGANQDFMKAIELEPGYATSHAWFGEILMAQRRPEEAFEQFNHAAAADPLSVVISHVKGYSLLYSNRLDEAEMQYLATLEMGPANRWTYQNLDILYTMRGNYDEARKYVRKLARLEGFDPAADLARIDAVENPKLKEHALALLDQRTDILLGVYGKAMQYALLDEIDLALDSLEQAFEAGDPYGTHMNWTFVYEPLHDNPRFQAMLKKMNQLPE